MRKPNFFIIGAPKCGTTSLAGWLAEHPQVFMSQPKEPDQFDVDRRKGWGRTKPIERYELAFSGAKEVHRAVGEASTGYLRSGEAVAEILRYAPNARFIVGIRNPVDLAFSWHGQVIFEAWENELCFERAWRLQEARRQGLPVPPLCPDVQNLLYADVCRLGQQLSRVFSLVSRNRVLIYTLDEMRDDPGALWARVTSFLEIDDGGRNQFPLLNLAKDVPFLMRALTRVVSDIKRRLDISHGLGLINLGNRLLGGRRRSSLSAQMRAELEDFFHEDLLLLQEVTKLDLSGWMPPKMPVPSASNFEELPSN